MKLVGIHTLRPSIILFSLAVILFFGSGCSQHARVARCLAKADKDFESEHYDRAEVEYLTVLKLAPGDPSATVHLGMIYRAQGRLPQAYAYLKKAVELAPDNLAAHLELGLLLASAHNINEARSQATLVLQKEPANEDALLLLVDTASDAAEMDKIIRQVESNTQRDNCPAAFHLAAGALCLRQQDLNRAESELSYAIRLEPNSPRAYLILGNLHLLRNNLAQAEQNLKKSAELSNLHSNRKLSYAHFKLKSGAPEEAKEYAEAIVNKAPDCIPAWIFLGQLAFNERRFEECNHVVDRVLGRDPSNYDALLLKGNALISQGNGTNAVTHFERLTTIFKGDPQIFAQLAVAHLLNLDVPRARSCLIQALDANPNFADATLLLSELDIRQGKAGVAIAAMQKLVGQQPYLARAHFLLADACAGQKDFNSAIGVYRRMMELFPQNPHVPLLMGIQLAQHDQVADARRAFEKSLQLSPDSIAPFEHLVNLDLAEKHYAEATVRVNSRLQKTPHSANPWLLYAKIYMAQGEMDKAENALLEAIELEPDLRNPYLLLADVYRTSDRRQQAIDKLNVLLAKNRNDPPALLQLALLQASLTNYPAAQDAYERLLSVHPNSGVVLNNLSCLYAEHLGQLDKAYELACKARRLYPADPFTADTLGWILFKQRDYLHALGSLEESARYLSDVAEVQFHLGMAYYMMGQEESARTALQKATQSQNDFIGKSDAARRLAILTAATSRSSNIQQASDLENHLRSDSDDPVVLSRLAALSERLGHIREAATYYQRALQVNSQNPFIMSRLAHLTAERLGDLPKALELAKDAHNLAPDDPRVSYTLGRLVYLQGDQKWALSLLEESASRLPSDGAIQFDLAQTLYSLGEVEKARLSMENAINLEPHFPKADEARAFLTLIAAAQDRNKSADAAAQARAVLTTNPHNLPALEVSALAFEQQGDYGKAKETYETILQVAPFFTPATRNLALLCAEHLGDYPRAYQLAATVRESFPDDPDIARTLGILTFRLAKSESDFTRSVRLLQESAVKRTMDSELFYYLGLAQYQTKEVGECKKALQKALALNLQTALAEDARRILSKLD
jgi:tetratricopeptide (TPR) repeat protein